MVLVSARLSDRSLRRYRRFAPRLMRDVMRAFAGIAAQTDVDRERFIRLGAQPAQVTVGGNLKFDLTLPVDITVQGAQLRTRCSPGRPLWVAGSTHAEEEAICIDAHRALLDTARATGRPPPLLVLAPRRPERFDAVAKWLRTTGLKSARLTGGEEAGSDVLLLDVMGGLLQWYAAADAAFVGGTLVPVGGHNLLEPAALGRPVIAGPHSFNSPESAELLRAADALTTVETAAQLTVALEKVLGDAPLARAKGARAASVVSTNRGAAARALALIASLPPRSGITGPQGQPSTTG
jgi:3-deoxy-D-manno-octulosonic-acid transferase